jgi:hypothetical protein
MSHRLLGYYFGESGPLIYYEIMNRLRDKIAEGEYTIDSGFGDLLCHARPCWKANAVAAARLSTFTLLKI